MQRTNRRPAGIPTPTVFDTAVRAGSSSTGGGPASGDVQFYPRDGEVFDFPDPKPEVTCAAPKFLALVELTHYVTFATQLWLAHTILRQPPPAAADCYSLFLIMMTPIFQGMAGFVPIICHEYEGWQVAPFSNLAADPPNPKYQNNELLRRTMYRSLFEWQAVAAGMGVVGVWGHATWTIPISLPVIGSSVPWVIILALVALVVLYTAPRNTLFFETPPFSKLDLHTLFPKTFKAGLLPTPLVVMLLFIASVAAYTFALHTFLGSWLVTALVVGLSAGGGLIEGLVAENTFNQFWHWVAVLSLNLGGLVQIFYLKGWWPF